jgi:hypothetical protein
MGIFARSKPQRVVRQYGRSSLLGFALLPLALLLGREGMERRQQAQALEMETDAAKMLKLGYRVESTEEYTMPLLSISYLKVTYELIDPPAQG